MGAFCHNYECYLDFLFICKVGLTKQNSRCMQSLPGDVCDGMCTCQHMYKINLGEQKLVHAHRFSLPCTTSVRQDVVFRGKHILSLYFSFPSPSIESISHRL